MSTFPFPEFEDAVAADQVRWVRATLPSFLEQLHHPRRSMMHFAVRVQLPDKKRECFWLTNLRQEADWLHGIVASCPSNHSLLDQALSVELDQVVDWLYVHNLRLIGGTSFRTSVMNTMKYFEQLERGSQLWPRPRDEETLFLGRLDRVCLPLDEELRIGAVFELFDAIGNQEQQKVKQLLLKGHLANARCNVVTRWSIAVSCESLTPLLYAIECENEHAAILCIESGADLDARAPLGMTALHCAIGRLPQLMRLLIDGGASLEARSNCGNTPLSTAVSGGCHDCMRILIAAGANVDDYHQLVPNGSTLRITVSPVLSGGLDLQAAKILFEAGANFDVKTHTGETALHIAAFNKRFDLAEFLIKIGCDPAVRTDQGETPASLAMKFPGDHKKAAIRFAARYGT